MKKILKVKVITEDNQYRALWSTMNQFNKLCNYISEYCFNNQTYHKVKVQKDIYYKTREEFDQFSSQLVIRAIDVVTSTYKTKRTKYPNQFKNTSAVVYDDRIITFKDGYVNIWTTEGRMKIKIHVYDKELFSFRKGQIDLIHKNGCFYLLVTVEVPDKEKIIPKDVIGVDLGIKNIATTSDNISYSGDIIEKKRKQYAGHRSRLQKRNTRNAKRKLKKIGDKEARFRKDVNHCISKDIVEKAKDTQSFIALEQLDGINKRVTVRKNYRNQRLSWSFYQLRTFIEYKAKQQGLDVILVNPKNTSRTCNVCQYCDKDNRKTQESFNCLNCGYAANADFNASVNIKTLGLQSISLMIPPKAVVSSPTACQWGS